MPNAKDRLLQATEPARPSRTSALHSETSRRGAVIQLAVTELKALEEAVALLNVSMPDQQPHR
jgi:hypothetical protein